MKKIICFLVVSLLLLSIVLAENGNKNIFAKKQEVQSKVVGLENAMLKVQSQEKVQHLQQVMEKIQAQWQERLNNLDDLEFEEDNGEVAAKGRGKALFLGFIPMKHTHRYRIMEDGTVVRQRWFTDFLFKDIEDDNIG